MKKAAVVRLASALGLAASLLAGCGSAPEVDRKTLLGSGGLKGSAETVFVSPAARERIYRLVAVMPFRAPVELAGASISDLFTTQLLKTYRYRLVERSQMEQVLGEQALGLKGVTDSALAVQVGKMLNVQGVIVGTVPEYGSKASGSKELSAIGINVRMIDVSDGSIVWSISDSAVSDQPISLSAFSQRIVERMINRLIEEWRRNGDTTAVNIAMPEFVFFEGRVRSAVLEVQGDRNGALTEIAIERAQAEGGPWREVMRTSSSGNKKIRLDDKGLQDAETYYYRAIGKVRDGFTSTPAGPVKIATVGPPPPVTGLQAASGLIRKIQLTWEASADPNVERYEISRKSGAKSWERLRSVSGRESTSATDEGLRDREDCSYRIAAVNIANISSPPSETATATTKGPPSPVSGVRAADGEPRRVTVSWEPVAEPEVKGYAIFRGDRESGPFKPIGFVSGRETAFAVDSGKQIESSSDEGDAGAKHPGTGSLADSTRYHYRVRAVNVVDVQSADSPTASALTKAVPTAVQGLAATQGEARQTTLSWDPNPEPDIANYVVFRSPRASDQGEQVQVAAAGATSVADKGLTPGVTYFYRVRAVDRDGLVGTFSAIAPAATKPLPKQPQSLRAAAREGAVTLAWTPNAEPDVARYVVQKKAFFGWDRVGEATAPELTYAGEMKQGKTLTFRVFAVDDAGQEGEPGPEANVTIP